MTPAEILPALTPDDIGELSDWLRRLPPQACGTVRLSLNVCILSTFLADLAYNRRQT